MFQKKDKGFTLIELLVVIAIIGLLASIVLVSLNSARKKARNAKRSSDITQLQLAFNMAYDNNGSFPSPGSYPYVCVSSSCYGGWSSFVASATVDAALEPFIKKTDDPSDSTRGYGGYLYLNPYNGGIYLNWLTEPPNTTGICGPGYVLNETANYVQCLLKLD